MTTDDADQEPCQACGGPLYAIGILGSRLHLRCRNCGADFSRTVEREDVDLPHDEPPGGISG